MFNLGKDMDIFWGLLDSEVSDQTDETITEENPNDLGAEDQTAWTEGTTDSNNWEEISTEDTVTDTEDVEVKEEITDEVTEENFEKETNEEKTWEEVIEEAWNILDDLLKEVNEKIEDSDNTEQVKMLEELQKNIQEWQIRIKELEEENKVFQDKYFEKFSETSEYNLMKPYIDVVQWDPELFLLVKSFKWNDSEWKLNTLITMIEKESWVDIKEYLTDNWKAAVSWVTSTKSGWDSPSWIQESTFEKPETYRESLY